MSDLRITAPMKPGESVRPKPKARFTVGLDLGQAQDYSALSVVQHVGREYHVRDLRRWQLGTRYPDVVADVAELVRTRVLHGPRLVVDATGVGRPVVEMFEDAGLHPYAVWITGGDKVQRDGTEYRVPKRELASTLQALLQSGRLKFARGLRHGDTLRREMQHFKVKVNLATGHDSYEHWRDGDHDDLVLSLAMACWMGEHGRSGKSASVAL